MHHTENGATLAKGMQKEPQRTPQLHPHTLHLYTHTPHICKIICRFDLFTGFTELLSFCGLELWFEFWLIN